MLRLLARERSILARLLRRRWAVSLVLGALVLLPAATPAVPADSEYSYTIDFSREEMAVVLRFEIRGSNDFIFLTTYSGRPVLDLKVRDGQGDRFVQQSGDDSVYRVDNLAPGMVEATYRVKLDPECRTGSCHGADGALLRGGDALLYPMRVNPAFHSPCRMTLLLPGDWKLFTTDGLMEPTLSAGSLAALGDRVFLPGDYLLASTPGGTTVAVQRSGWRAGAETVRRILTLNLQEQDRILGKAGHGARHVMRVTPEAQNNAELFAATPSLSLLKLKGSLDRFSLSAQMVPPLSSLFRSRLAAGLAHAENPATRWWQRGFAEYASLLAAIRSGALAEDALITRLFDSWNLVRKGSPLAGHTSLAAAGEMEGADAERFLTEGGLLTCFLLDVRIRTAPESRQTLGDLLSATVGQDVTNTLLLNEASRLAGASLMDLFQMSVLDPQGPPLQQEAFRAGLELAKAGTGKPFLGMMLEESEPVIARVVDPGPASHKGLRVGDRLTTVDGVPVHDAPAALAALSAHGPGERLAVTVKTDDGQIYSVEFGVWEEVRSVLRRARKAPAASVTAWNELVRGTLETFAN